MRSGCYLFGAALQWNIEALPVCAYAERVSPDCAGEMTKVDMPPIVALLESTYMHCMGSLRPILFKPSATESIGTCGQ